LQIIVSTQYGIVLTIVSISFYTAIVNDRYSCVQFTVQVFRSLATLSKQTKTMCGSQQMTSSLYQ